MCNESLETTEDESRPVPTGVVPGIHNASGEFMPAPGENNAARTASSSRSVRTMIRDALQSLDVADLCIHRLRDGSFYLEMPNGEGMQISEGALAYELRNVFSRLF